MQTNCSTAAKIRSCTGKSFRLSVRRKCAWEEFKEVLGKFSLKFEAVVDVNKSNAS
jgi:hypothetical protein